MTARTYTLKKRAEQQADTRLRIVEAAVDLHGSVGPARTTFSMVAEKAGVQRHTLYAHFPDERALLKACSGLHGERQPLPDANAWRAIANREERLRRGLNEIYEWYGRNAQLVACVLRDAEYDPLVRETAHKAFGPHMAAFNEVLGEKMSAKQRAMLHLALSFYTWRTLARDEGMKPAAAVDAMVKAMESAAK
jgi:AcrR family transcriptional regulator